MNGVAYTIDKIDAINTIGTMILNFITFLLLLVQIKQIFQNKQLEPSNGQTIIYTDVNFYVPPKQEKERTITYKTSNHSQTTDDTVGQGLGMLFAFIIGFGIYAIFYPIISLVVASFIVFVAFKGRNIMIINQPFLVSLKWIIFIIGVFLISCSSLLIPKEIQAVFEQVPMLNVEHFSNIVTWCSSLMVIAEENKTNVYLIAFLVGRLLAFVIIISWAVRYFFKKSYYKTLVGYNNMSKKKMSLFICLDIVGLVFIMVLMHLNSVWPFLESAFHAIQSWSQS